MTTARDMIEAIETCIRLDEDFSLSEWEEKFVIDIGEKVKAGRTLTEKQAEVLEQIYDRT
jgi:hypothetical protein